MEEAPWVGVHGGEDRVHQGVTLEEGEGAFHEEAYLEEVKVNSLTFSKFTLITSMLIVKLTLFCATLIGERKNEIFGVIF